MLLKSFELTTVDIGTVALDELHALSVGVRWPHRGDDWRFLLERGRGIAALDEIGRIAGSAMWFPYSTSFATIGMVITSPRLQAQGAGRWLMRQVMAASGGRALGLNATRAAYRLYRSLGFVEEATVYQIQGEMPVLAEIDRPPPDGILREVGPDDLPALASLDAEAFGVARFELFAALLQQSRGRALVRGGQVVAFALCRRFGRGLVLGPLVASSDADAIAVMAPLAAGAAGTFLRIDTRRPGGDFRAFVERMGLPIFDTVVTMSYAARLPQFSADHRLGMPTIYALAGHALS